MEIIVFPYMAISALFAWAIFSPFAVIEGLDEWSFSRLRTGDLLAIFLPIGLALTIGNLILPTARRSTVSLAVLAILAICFGLFALFIGLFLFAKMKNASSAKRATTIAIVIPLGTLLVVGWIAVPAVAYAGPVHYSIPAVIGLVPITWGIRKLSSWVCDQEQQVA